MSEETSQEGGDSKGTVMAALVANGGIAVTKFIAAALSGSSAMLVEGIHSVVDTGNQAFLLLGMKRARRPADEKHPFGYGAEIYFWSFIVAVLLFSLGAGLSIWEGVRALLHGESEGGGVPWIPYVVLALAFAFEGYSWQKAVREFNRVRAGRGLWSDLKETKDPAIFVVLCEDTAALLGILIAALGVTLHWQLDHPFWDAAASILIGLLLGLVAIFLANEVRGLLVGEFDRSGHRRQRPREPECARRGRRRERHPLDPFRPPRRPAHDQRRFQGRRAGGADRGNRHRLREADQGEVLRRQPPVPRGAVGIRSSRDGRKAPLTPGAWPGPAAAHRGRPFADLTPPERGPARRDRPDRRACPLRVPEARPACCAPPPRRCGSAGCGGGP